MKIRKKKAEEKKSGAAAAPAAETAQPETAHPEAPQPEAETPQTPKAQSPAAEAAAAPPATSNQQPATTSKLEKFKQEAGKRRQAEAAQAFEETTENYLELLTFVMAGEQYAVDIERIVEIVTPRTVTRIPNADPSVVGIISLRGTIVTLVDVRRKLRHAAAGAATEDTRIVVIDFHHEMVGFLVDRVLRVVKTTRGAVEPHPVVHAGELDDSIRGVFRTGGALTILLDLDKLLDHTALAARTA
ncbi:MAG TPA: chemotaxis protein CheW [Thermoanaerobaculia bacterium]